MAKAQAPSETVKHWNFDYAAIYVSDCDTLDVIWGDQCFFDIVFSQISSYFQLCRKTSDVDNCAVKITVKGAPFASESFDRDEARILKMMICQILAQLLQYGWKLGLSSSLSGLANDSTLFFLRCPELGSPYGQPMSLLALTPSGQDTLCVINAPRPPPDDLMYSICKICNSNLPIKMKKEYPEGPDFRIIEFKQQIWGNLNKEEKVARTKIMTEIIDNLATQGYQFYGTTNLKGTLDTLYFLPPALAKQQKAELIVLTLNDEDVIRINSADKGILDGLKTAILNSWTQGIEQEGFYKHTNFFQWKLKGKPWCSSGTIAVESRYILTTIFDALSKYGYSCYATLKLSRSDTCKSTFVFQRSPKDTGPSAMQHACIMPAPNNTLCFLGFRNPKKTIILDTIEAVIREWCGGFAEEPERNEKLTEFRMKEILWKDARQKDSATRVRVLMLHLVRILHENGWRVLSSAGACNKTGQSFLSRSSVPSTNYPDCWVVARTVSDHDNNFFTQYNSAAPPPYEEVMGSTSKTQQVSPLTEC